METAAITAHVPRRAAGIQVPTAVADTRLRLPVAVATRAAIQLRPPVVEATQLRLLVVVGIRLRAVVVDIRRRATVVDQLRAAVAEVAVANIPPAATMGHITDTN